MFGSFPPRKLVLVGTAQLHVFCHQEHSAHLTPRTVGLGCCQTSSWLLVVFPPAKPLQGWVRGEQIGAVFSVFYF